MTVKFAFLPVRDFTLSPLSLFIDTLRLAGDEGDRSRRIEFDWQILGDRGLPIRASCGIELMPTASFTRPEDYDHVVVVGGLLQARRDLAPAAEAFLLSAAKQAMPITALCTGSFVLARYGLLNGYRASISWFHIRDFRSSFPEVSAEADSLFIVDRTRATCAGGAGAADLASHFATLAVNSQAAQKAAKILILDRIRSFRDVQPATDLFPEARSREIRRALLTMEGNLEQPLAIPEIAKRLNLSRRQLERRFAAELGTSPTAAYVALRIRQARALIETSDLAMDDIGFRSGFSNPAHFSRVFRQHVGMSPTGFRQSRRRAG